MRMPFTFSCPSCGTPGQNFPFHDYIEKETRTHCRECAAEIVSALGHVKFAICYALVLISLAPVGIVLLAGILTAQWLWVAVAFTVGGFFCGVPMFFHSRNAQLPMADRRPQRYGRSGMP